MINSPHLPPCTEPGGALVSATFRHYALSLIASVALIGCASNEEKVTAVLDEAVPSGLSTYSDMRTFPGNVTCGKYLDYDWQGMPEYKRFIVVDTVSNLRPTDMDMEIFCSEKPLEALNNSLGIDYLAQKATIARIMKDFEALADPLLAYEQDNNYFPTTEQGLEALIEPSKVGSYPRRFREGGYIQQIPVDPWNNAYDYTCSSFAGIRTVYKIRSFGADGQEGGSGPNADIHVKHMKYFKHLDQVYN
jgi:general secretion pathway protein G